MRGVGGPFGDPAFEQGDLGGFQGRRGFGRGHREFGVVDLDAEDQVAGVGVAGDDGGGAGFEGEGGSLGHIEAETGLALALVGAVAGEAVLGEDGADVAVEIEGFLGLGGEGSR